MNKYFFQLKKERHLKKIAAATGDRYCHKCEKWGYFCKCD